MQRIEPQLIKHLFALCLVTFSSVSMAQQTMQIIPAAPRFLEPVYARIHQIAGSMSYQCVYGAQVIMAGTVITVNYHFYTELCGYDYDVELGRFPTGTYTVNLQRGAYLTNTTAQFTVGASLSNPTTSFPGNQPTVNYSDMWWSPSESGWGLSITQGATNQLFAVWYVYSASGEPIWYTLQPGTWTDTGSSSTYTGPIYKTTGPYFMGAFNPALVGVTQVGNGTLSFRQANSGTLNYVIDGVRVLKDIQRQIIE